MRATGFTGANERWTFGFLRVGSCTRGGFLLLQFRRGATATEPAALGAEIGQRGLALVYGGTHKGLMGVLADAALNAGGHVTGIITRRLADRGHLHPHLTRHEIAADMRSRKARMLALADACIALPGGIGTVEEFMEAWTLNQLGDVDRPVGLYNVEGFFTSLLTFVDGMIERGFLPAAHRDSLAVGDCPKALIEALALQPPITVSKWMS